ncbi:IclR family transcriptional regulator [Rossellomorea sp. BNER]|uniref:IclR family transcriptional regulator n=1 Tax=Rossellomorea sp. BNER TaxID=2962031 RepID=UPI003AF2EB52|nr:IclR family transcriptional regulator [Rossellomorea sp. BNER]
MSKTLGKALQLLTFFTEEKPYWRLDEISRKADIPKPTTYRLLKTFEEYGFVQKVYFQQKDLVIEGERYELGTRLLELGQIAQSKFEIRNIALPYMRDLQQSLNESVQLVIMENNEGVYIEKVESNMPVRLYTKIGRRAPLYAGACPRVLLSFLPDHKIEEILTQPTEKIGTNTFRTMEEIWGSIYSTREKGYTYSNSELEDGTAAFGTPIFDRFGDIAASLSVAGFATMLREEEAMRYVIPMWEVSEKISRQLGFTKPYKYLQMRSGDFEKKR